MYLGLDLGTSGLKALLIDAAQQPIGSATAPLTASRPQEGWSEQDPAQWITACEAALDALKAAHPRELAAVKGIGLSGQMHGATVLDAADQVLRPAILWNDSRASAEATWLDADPRFREISGNIVFPGFTAPKLLWMREEEPELFARIAKVLLPKDYLRLWLAGEHVSEMSDAAGTSWLDTGARDWSAVLLEASGMEARQMPRLVEGSEVSGVLRAGLAQRWGFGAGVVVAGGAGDNAASGVGMGTVRAGEGFVSLGTSGVVFVANDSYLPRPESAVHAFCHALPGHWHQMGVILAATDALNWFARLMDTAPEALVGALGPDLAAPGPVSFLPYLGGERTPHNSASLRGSFIGLGHASDRPALTRALLEGVAFALADSLDALRAAGSRPASLFAVGGGARSGYWLKSIATALGVPLELPAEGDFGAAFGAARLGLAAAEAADPLGICTPPKVARVIEPDAALAGAYGEARERFRAAGPGRAV